MTLGAFEPLHRYVHSFLMGLGKRLNRYPDPVRTEPTVNGTLNEDGLFASGRKRRRSTLIPANARILYPLRSLLFAGKPCL